MSKNKKKFLVLPGHAVWCSTTDSKAIQEHSVYLKIIMEAIRSNFRRILFSTVSISCSQNLSAQCTDKSRIHIVKCIYISHITFQVYKACIWRTVILQNTIPTAGWTCSWSEDLLPESSSSSSSSSSSNSSKSNDNATFCIKDRQHIQYTHPNLT